MDHALSIKSITKFLHLPSRPTGQAVAAWVVLFGLYVATPLNAQGDFRANLSTADITHDGSNLMWWGDFPTALYDGDTSTLGLVNFADEPVAITILLPTLVAANSIRLFYSAASGDPAYEWSAACAANLQDLNTETATFRSLAQNIPTLSDVWSASSFDTANCAAFRITGYRLTGDHFLHITELEILLDEPAPGLERHLINPAGLQFAPDGGLVIADAGRDALVRHQESQQSPQIIGEGLLSAPHDVAIDAEKRILVADTGNDRVLRLHPDGAFDAVIVSASSESPSVNSPRGVAIDQTQRILIADTGNHRILRLNADGTLDTSFGANGIVGGPDPVLNGSQGFNMPSGIHWNSYTGQILIADTGNNRLQILNPDGSYARSINAVYQPYAITTRSDGTIFIAGEGEQYPPASGSLRIVKPGRSFISTQFLNGIASVAKVTGGVGLDPDGNVVVSEMSTGRLLRVPPSLQEDIKNFSFEARATELVVRYKTLHPTPTRVLLSSDHSASEHFDSKAVTNHEILISDLSPDTVYRLSVAYPRGFDRHIAFSPDVTLRTEPSAHEMNVMKLRTIGAIYTHGLTPERIEAAKERLRIVERFFYLNSRARLHLDIEVVEIDRAYGTEDIHAWGGFKVTSVEQDLINLGYSEADQIDEVIVYFGGIPDLPGGNFGGGGGMFGRFIGYTSYVTETPFVAIHEVSHTIDAIYAHSGYQDYAFNHGLWAIGSTSGKDLIVNAEILRNVPPSTYPILEAPFTRRVAPTDIDADGLPDFGDLPFTEETLGTSALLLDSDFDGIGDLEELLIGTSVGTSTLNANSDRDAILQGCDRIDANPTIAINRYVLPGSPSIDGTIEDGEGWTSVSDRINLTNDYLYHLNDDPDDMQDVRVWSAWDSEAIYFAIESPPAIGLFDIDANADGWFAGFENYRIEFDTNGLRRMAVAAADRDLMFSIHPSGEWSEIFDDSEKWLSARPQGLGLERLADPADISFRSSFSGDLITLELRIPANPSVGFTPMAGNEVSMFLRLNDDVIWDDDRFARLLLIEGIDTTGDGLWDFQENDLGSNPSLEDSDGDGMADPMEIGLCTDPLRPDTDTDGLNDPIDPVPLDPRRLVETPNIASVSQGSFSDKVRIDWRSSIDADRVVVLRCESADFSSCSLIARAAAEEGFYDDHHAPADGRTISYRIIACKDSRGCSDPSTEAVGYRFADSIFWDDFHER